MTRFEEANEQNSPQSHHRHRPSRPPARLLLRQGWRPLRLSSPPATHVVPCVLGLKGSGVQISMFSRKRPPALPLNLIPWKLPLSPDLVPFLPNLQILIRLNPFPCRVSGQRLKGLTSVEPVSLRKISPNPPLGIQTQSSNLVFQTA
jgi:hypothetical protein